MSRPFPAASSEEQLIETLRTAEPAEKAIACKQLAIHGSKAAVPELAKLLTDEQLASWSRIALEAIPDPAAEQRSSRQRKRCKGKLLGGHDQFDRRPPTVAAVDALADAA